MPELCIKNRGLKFRFRAFFGWFDLSRSYKEIYIFLWVGGGGYSKNLKIRGSAWVSRPALFCECFFLKSFFKIFFVLYHLMLGIFKARKYGMGFLGG